MPLVVPQYAAVGTLVAGGGTGNESVTGLAITPSLVLLMWNPTNATEDSFGFDFHIGFGAIDAAVNQFASYMWVDDGSISAPGSGAILNTQCLTSRTGSGQASAVSLDADGFTINWSEAPAAGQDVYYIAFNEDVFSAEVGMMTLPNGGGVAISGLSFDPTSLLLNYALGNQFGIGVAARNGDPDGTGPTNQEALAGAQFAFVTASSSDAYSFLEGAYGAGSVMHVADSVQINPDPESYYVTSWDTGGVSLSTQSTGGQGAVSAGYVAIRCELPLASNVPVARSHVSFSDVPVGGPPQSPVRDLRAAADPYFAGDRISPLCGVFCSPLYANGVGDFGVNIGFIDDALNQRSCWSANAYLDDPSEAENYPDPDVVVAFRYPESNTIYTEGTVASWDQFGFTIDYPTFLDSSGAPFGGTSRFFYALWGHSSQPAWTPQIYRLVKV